MADYWEDRISKEQHAKCAAALKKFRASRRRRDDELDLYDTLTNNGVQGEEADEIINMEIENADEE